jgi:hypothetical protein
MNFQSQFPIAVRKGLVSGERLSAASSGTGLQEAAREDNHD